MSVPVEFVNDRGNKVEIKDTEARRLAGVAQTAAENAQSTAGGANTLAQQAKDKADTAYTDAGTAQSTATAAGTLAQQAKDIADAASSAASTNAENISTLNGKVTALEGSISDIEEDIETIKEDYISKEELQPYDMLEETDNLPLTFTTNGESLIDYKIYGNSNSNHIDEVTNNLPITIPNAKAGIVEDWTIEGNNIPQVENITKELPITFPSNGDNITDYTIYGNNNPCEPEPEGILPLSFTTAETVLRDWQIDGNNNPNYVETTSVLPLSFTTRTAGNVSDWSIIGNNNIGKNLCDETNFSILQTDTDAYRLAFSLGKIPAGDYTLSYTKNQTSVLYITFRIGTTYSSATADTPYTFSVSSNVDEVIVRTALQTEAPLTDIGISNVMLNAGSTAATFEPYQIGVGQKTKNLLEITTGTYTDHGVKFTFDKETGVVVADGKATGAQARYAFYITPTETLNLYLSGCPEGGSSSTYNVYPWDSTAGARPKKWDGTTSQTESDYGTDGLEVRAEAGHKLSVTIRIEEGYTANNVVFKPMYRLSDTSTDFEPFGYKIPLTVNSTTQNIYIGSTPLTAGQSVSKTSTGIDIAAQIGTNTITTDLFNKPEMYVKALDYIGIGERTKNLFSSATAETKTNGNLSVTCDGNGGYTINKTGALAEETIVMFDIPEFTIPISQSQGGSGIIALFNTKMTTGFQIWFYYNDTYITYYSLSTAANRVMSNYESLSGATINKIGFRMSSTSNTATETGTLTPMTVDDSVAPTDFIPYGYQIPLAVQGKNLLELEVDSGTVNNVTFTVNKNAGIIVANSSGAASATTTISWQKKFSAGTYLFNAQLNGASDTYRMDVSKQDWTFLAVNYTGENTITLSEDTTLRFRIVIFSGYTANNVVFKPMIRLANTSTNFVPYFHKDHTFYIGDTPLTEGENISKTSTGVDIETQIGENTISTTLYNKPEMYCGMALGVGMPTENLLEITEDTTSSYDVTFTVDRQTGTVTATGRSSSTSVNTPQFNFNGSDRKPLSNGVVRDGYIFSCPNLIYGAQTGIAYYNENQSYISEQYCDSTTSSRTISIPSNAVYYRFYLCKNYNAGNTDVIFKPMLRLPDTSTDFEPYGYKVPITITDENSNTVERTFYIGSSRLLSGDTYTKTQAGIDIPTTSGNNIISTTLYNKPEMNVVCNSNVLGVGERTENLWNLTIEQGSFDPTTGATAVGSRRVRTAESIQLSANSWTVAITGVDRCGVYVYDTSGNYIESESKYYWQALPFTFTLSGERKVKFVFSTNDDAQITPSMVSQPMLVKGSTAPSSYIPYGYELPITVMGENLFDETATDVDKGFEEKRYIKGDGSTIGNANWNISEYLDVQSSSRYILIYGSNNETPGVCYYTSEKEYISGVSYNGQSVIVLDIPSNAKYIRFSYMRSNGINPILQRVYDYDIYIGNSPLTAEQSISKTSTSTDIALLSGTNTISTSLNNKPNMFISYQSGELGVGVRTVNLYNPNAADVNNGYVNPGRLRIDGTINTSAVSINVWVTEYITVEEDSLYTLVDLLQTSVYGICYYDNNKTYILGETYSGVPNHGNKTITTPTGCKYVRFTAAEDFNTMLVKGSIAPEAFIQYGYEIPIRIYDGEANTENTNYTDLNFYIGNSLLSADEYIDFINNKIYKYVSSVLTPTNPIVDLPVIPTNGTNTIDTTLYNKPEMYIKYSTDSFSRIFTTTLPTTFINHSDKVKDWIIYGNENGVGEEGNDGYIIPLVVNGNTINIPIGSAALTEGETVSRTSTNIDIPTIDGENTINTTLTNKPTMKITKDFVTKEYIEDVANSCMNDNVEDIVENVVDEQMSFMFYSPINKNGMFRGKDLTNVYTVDEIYQKVSSGTFDDLYLGDYFTKSITTDIYTKFTGSAFVEGTTYYTRTGTLNNWVYAETEDTSYDSSKTYYTKTTKTENVSLMIAHFNYYYNIGDTAFTNPHIILTNRNYGFATTSKMNPTNTTVGGYYNSEMHQTTLPCYAKSLKTALNNHLLSHKTLLSNAINASTPSMAGAGLTGASSGWAWYDTELQLMTEQQLFGSGIWTSSAYDVGCDGEKLAVFNFVNGVQNGRSSFWLRSVASSARFADCYYTGLAHYYGASTAYYVRPLIVFG